MAKPIQPTPPLEGQDAEDLLASLERHVPEEEARRRVEEAREWLARVMAPKGHVGKPSTGR